MIKNKKLSYFALIPLFVLILGVFSVSQTANAQTPEQQCQSLLNDPADPGNIGYNECVNQIRAAQNGIPSENTGSSSSDSWTGSATDANCEESISAQDCGITWYLVVAINILSALAGIAIAISIAYGGIEYSMSGSDPQKVSAAKDRIRNAIIALIFFIFGFAILNYLIPGGLL